MIQLTKAEEEIMQIIWEKEKCLVSDIIASLENPETPHSTISSVVRILEKKGFVNHKAYGRTYEYFPVISKEAYAQKGFKSWFASYFDSSPAQLASFFVNEKALKPKEIDELLQQLEQLKKK
ncbi:MAG: BlaI/MecI/CopY family transcriptional regulator [Sphingobacteriales bacterium]|nr:MAG: BlaI/MecI/CopY family transcriptional regulator [Sphingobacteriales bacterium]